MTNNNPVALVTGASSGIGEAAAIKLAAAGYTVYGTSRMGAGAGERTFPLLRLDVTDDTSVEAAVSELLQREGRIDLLVNNAGFGIAPASALESSIDQAKALFDTNFLGIVRLIHAVVPHMRQQGSGQIINISSILGVVPMPYVALYAASKHAVEGYSEALDHELRTDGIRVSLIEPAYTKTQFEANNIQPDARLAEFDLLRQKLAGVVTQAMATADEPDVVAETILEAVRAKRPKLRYTAGKAAAQLQFLRRFAPASVLDSGIRKNLKLETKTPERIVFAGLRP
ncbi:Short chain dehydrogenase [Pseudomonas amygdali pv. dendropanacis]|uniref:Short chain dehydrogenase n=1 Tax=Pseudomonas amygdali pv. dendropanacis TaxID=235272 RepID=A0A0N8RFM4_PSEA0|nr:oxidoreductase [Pseudomonas amygdali]KPX23599.1 Short chain dehydrogenase [Pseudomonas amygdali pv. dendropanacis]KWS81246.1 short-chain dehydrogenase [Pseudomonas amygdali pv. dendropanacis]